MDVKVGLLIVYFKLQTLDQAKEVGVITDQEKEREGRVRVQDEGDRVRERDMG